MNPWSKLYDHLSVALFIKGFYFFIIANIYAGYNREGTLSIDHLIHLVGTGVLTLICSLAWIYVGEQDMKWLEKYECDN